jgi:hypothetical protein
LRRVKIPGQIINDLKEVYEAIQRKDEVTLEDTDDGIQVGCLCGSFMDDDSGRFYFSVHLKGNSPYVWDIALSPQEIAKIIAGRKRTLALWCCANPDCGFKTYIEEITCHWCDYGGDRTRKPWDI